MRVLAINHERDAGPGVFADAIAAAGGELDQWYRAETDVPPADLGAYDAVMTFGGAMHVDQGDLHPWIAAEEGLIAELLERETPVLAVCLGAQLLSEAAGGNAQRLPEAEVGWYEVEVTEEGAADPLLGSLAPRFEAFEWHSYGCGPPEEATILARTPACVQAFRIGSAWGIQFHAEVTVADLASWIDEYGDEPDAIAIGVDPDGLSAETMPRMSSWNELGRQLCGRFLAVVAAHPGARV